MRNETVPPHIEEQIKIWVGDLKKLLEWQGLSQRDWAEQSGVYRSQIQRILEGSSLPSGDTIKRLLDGIGLTQAQTKEAFRELNLSVVTQGFLMVLEARHAYFLRFAELHRNLIHLSIARRVKIARGAGGFDQKWIEHGDKKQGFTEEGVRQKFTQEQLSQKAGISRQALYEIENGKSGVRHEKYLEYLRKIAGAFDRNSGYFHPKSGELNGLFKDDVLAELDSQELEEFRRMRPEWSKLQAEVLKHKDFLAKEASGMNVPSGARKCQ